MSTLKLYVYIYIYMNNITPKRHAETLRKNETPAETELTTLVNLAIDALGMVSLEELQNASLCWWSKRTIAHINVKGGDWWDIVINGQQHVQPTLRSRVAIVKMLQWKLHQPLTKMVQPMCCHHLCYNWWHLVLPLILINKGIIWEQNESESMWRE